MEEEIKLGEVLNQQIVMPTHKELIEAKKYNLPILRFGSYAVYNKKVSSKQRSKVMTLNNVKTEREILEGLHKEYKYDFLTNIQVANQTEFTNREVDFIEQIQQTPSVKQMCMREQTYQFSPAEFEDQLKRWKGNNPNKEIIPISEVYTRDYTGKIKICQKHKIKSYGVVFRSYKNHKADLSRILFEIKKAGMKNIVFEVNPKKWKSSQASMLLPAIQFKADMVASYIPWSGGLTPLTLLDDDWIFREVNEATQGLAKYGNNTRKQMVRANINYNTTFSKVDTINQANLMLRKFKPLQKVVFESLFN